MIFSLVQILQYIGNNRVIESCVTWRKILKNYHETMFFNQKMYIHWVTLNEVENILSKMPSIAAASQCKIYLYSSTNTTKHVSAWLTNISEFMNEMSLWRLLFLISALF